MINAPLIGVGVYLFWRMFPKQIVVFLLKMKIIAKKMQYWARNRYAKRNGYERMIGNLLDQKVYWLYSGNK